MPLNLARSVDPAGIAGTQEPWRVGLWSRPYDWIPPLSGGMTN